MFQTIDNKFGFVVDIKESPRTLLPIINDEGPFMQPYVDALDSAIRRGIVKEPGKYHIVIEPSTKEFEIHRIIE